MTRSAPGPGEKSADARKFSAFRAFRTELREAFAGYRSPNVFLDVLLGWGTTRIGMARVSHTL